MGEIEYFKVDLECILEVLRGYFSFRSDILIAILYGSTLRRDTVRDVDIAVYTREYSLDQILRVSWEVEELLGIPADIVPLESLPPDLRLEVLLNGTPIAVRDRALYTELIKESIAELEDIEIATRIATQREHQTPYSG